MRRWAVLTSFAVTAVIVSPAVSQPGEVAQSIDSVAVGSTDVGRDGLSSAMDERTILDSNSAEDDAPESRLPLPTQSAEQRTRQRSEDPTPARILAEPVAVRVPAVEIDVELDRLGLDSEGALEVPADFGRGGWFAGGPKPGDIGPAVIAAHVDSLDGPAPFYRLGEIGPGDLIDVVYSDGTVVQFVAIRVGQYDKEQFPTLQVYGNTERPELRLITCGGEFDGRERSYEDNIIVWAVERAPTAPLFS